MQEMQHKDHRKELHSNQVLHRIKQQLQVVVLLTLHRQALQAELPVDRRD